MLLLLFLSVFYSELIFLISSVLNIRCENRRLLVSFFFFPFFSNKKQSGTIQIIRSFILRKYRRNAYGELEAQLDVSGLSSWY